MNPICAVAFVTLSLSMKGAMGKPSFFSLSDWKVQYFCRATASFALCGKEIDFRQLQPCYVLLCSTWWKYSSNKHSTQCSDIMNGRHSLETSHAFIKIIFSEVKWSSELKSKLSTFCLNASRISACLAMSVAKIKTIMSCKRKEQMLAILFYA